MLATGHLDFDELYAVSDLHFGGKEGFQIFGSTDEFVWLLQDLQQRAMKDRIGLVINGDFVDFLAEEPSRHFDPELANQKLDRIIGDKAFAPIFIGLQKYLSAPNAYLLINLGNHDLELALPWVQEYLSSILCHGQPAAQARLKWCLNGTGIRCRVGHADVLFLHGNEFDEWNAIDYHHLRKLTRDWQFGLPVVPWKPNAGSRMVVEVMNDIKSTHPFVDLLKPEVEGVVKALPFLVKGLGKVLDAATFAAVATKDKARIAMDVLSAGTAGEDSLPPEPAGDQAEVDFLDRLARGETDDNASDVLGFFAAAMALNKSKPELLRRAIQEVAKDQSFNLRDPDPTYKAATARTNLDIHFLVTGHTHLLRAIPRRRGAYFNSGTWARLVEVLPEYLQDEQHFKPVFEVMTARTMEGLDALKDSSGRALVKRLCPVVCIRQTEHGVLGEIAAVRSKQLVPMPNTQFLAAVGADHA